MSKSRQADIASFFTRQPKPAGAGKSEAAGSPNENAGPSDVAAAKPAPKRKPEQDAEAGKPPAEPAAAAEPSKKPLKRLRKAGGEGAALPAQQQGGAAAEAAADELEDAGPSSSPRRQRSVSPAASAGAAAANAGGKAAAKAASPTPDAAALGAAEAAARAVEEEEGSEYEFEDEASSASEAEGEGREASPSSPSRAAGGKARGGAPKKRVKQAAKGAKSKVEGVGAEAIRAAAEHNSFDLDALVTWKAGEPVPFSLLASTFEAIADTTKRLERTGILINAFRAVIAATPADLLPMVYLCTNRVAPAHAGVELGIGDATLVKALAQATGRKESSIKAEYAECGDLGLVAFSSRGMQKTMFPPPPLTLRQVFKLFKDIAAVSGEKSQDRKKAFIIKLLAAAKGQEAGYVMRALQGKLRIGLGEETVLAALAHAAVLQKEGAQGSSETIAGRLERAAQIVKQVYSECPSYDELVPALLERPIEDLPQHVHFKPGVPVKPMLAKPTTGVSEVLDKFTDEEFTCEYKYDGERAQIHVLPGGVVKIYSRNSEDNTTKYPDIAKLIPKQLKPGISSVVLDAEAVAFDHGTGKILPFQILSTRARKDVTVENIKVNVCVYAFDCLSINGRTLLREPLTARREALGSALEPLHGHLEFATAKTSRDVEELTRFLDDSVEAGTEGLIVKTVADSYEPSKRSSHWLKLKKDYLEGVGDTFDLVPIGAWYGKGKRTGVYGSYLLAVYEPEVEEYQTLCKIGTGFSEEVLKQLAEQMQGLAIPEARKYYRYGDSLVPDVWFDAKAVWEVKAADLSISPVHKAALGQVDPSKGISIRFPRLVRVRDDKGPEDATAAEQVAEMYRKQAVLQQKQKKGGGADDD